MPARDPARLRLEQIAHAPDRPQWQVLAGSLPAFLPQAIDQHLQPVRIEIPG